MLLLAADCGELPVARHHNRVVIHRQNHPSQTFLHGLGIATRQIRPTDRPGKQEVSTEHDRRAVAVSWGDEHRGAFGVARCVRDGQRHPSDVQHRPFLESPHILRLSEFELALGHGQQLIPGQRKT